MIEIIDENGKYVYDAEKMREYAEKYGEVLAYPYGSHIASKVEIDVTGKNTANSIAKLASMVVSNE